MRLFNDLVRVTNLSFEVLRRPFRTIGVIVTLSGFVVGTNLFAQDDSVTAGIELKNVSKSLRPGDDFYDYVNEKWLVETEIPADQSNYGAFTALDEATKQDVRVLIEQASIDKPSDGPAKQVGDLYDSYINLELRNELGVAPIKPLLSWVSDIKSKSDWIAVAAKLSRVGVDNPMGYYVEPDAKKSDQYAAYVSQSGISLPDRDYYLEDGFDAAREALKKYIVGLLQSIQYESAESSAEAIIAFETKLAAAQWSNTELRDPIASYNPIAVDKFAEGHPLLDWNSYSKVVGLPTDGVVIIGQPSFFDALQETIEQTDIATLKAYSTFHLLDTFADVLDEDHERQHFQFHKTAMSGVTEQEPLWKRGVQACNALLGMPVGQMYVAKHFSPEAKTRMEELVSNLKKAYEIRIGQLDWMGQGTKVRAVEKLDLITTKIGYPDQWKDYSAVPVSATDLVGNILAIAEFEHQYSIGKLGQPIDRGEWHMPPQTVNAYYNPLMNEIVFPAAILQPPFFNLLADDAVNYGAIGAVIGHEISHAFDDSGSKYDGYGNLKNWWTEQDRLEFDKRAEQLVQQYANYKPFPDANLNGKLTLGENIGDLGGLASAYTAYQLSLDGKAAPVIANLSGDQRFFMGWAQVWRRKYRELELRKRLLTDPHSPSKYRANGIVANMDAFYQAFDVSKDSAMFLAPETRVRIW